MPMNKREEQQMLEELRRKMAESYDQWYEENKDTLNPPPLDLSFMEQNPEVPNEQKSDGDERFHWFNLRSLRNAAAVFLMVIVLSSVATVWMNSNAAHALKFHIEKIFHETSNHYYSTGENGSTDDNAISVKVTEQKGLKTLQRRIPELILPKELPTGYSFILAQAKYWKNGNWTCELSYRKEDGNMLGIVEANNSDASEVETFIEAEELQTANGVVYYSEENDQIRGLFYMVGNIYVQISGTAEKDELLQVENSMR